MTKKRKLEPVSEGKCPGPTFLPVKQVHKFSSFEAEWGDSLRPCISILRLIPGPSGKTILEWVKK